MKWPSILLSFLSRLSYYGKIFTIHFEYMINFKKYLNVIGEEGEEIHPFG
jgi:hypothetical protein